MKIAICDDDRAQVDYLCALVLKWAEMRKCRTAVETYPSAEAFQFAWSEDRSIDLLLLDIQMPGQNGVELAREIRRADERIIILFITGYPDFMGEGYEVSALHYLLKPVEEGRFFVCLDRAVGMLEKEKPSLLVESSSGNTRILQEEIFYIEAFGHLSVIHSAKQSLETGEGIGQLEKSLDGEMFYRAHRSYLVNLRYVRTVGRTELVLDSGARLPVSRRLYDGLNKAFIRFYRGQ